MKTAAWDEDGTERPFNIDDYYRTAACFLSHYFLLRRLRDSAEKEMVMIVEDDVVFAPDFSERASRGDFAPETLELPGHWDVLKTCLQGDVRQEDAISADLYRVVLPTAEGRWTGGGGWMERERSVILASSEIGQEFAAVWMATHWAGAVGGAQGLG